VDWPRSSQPWDRCSTPDRKDRHNCTARRSIVWSISASYAVSTAGSSPGAEGRLIVGAWNCRSYRKPLRPVPPFLHPPWSIAGQKFNCRAVTGVSLAQHRSGSVVLQNGRSRVRDPIMWMPFFFNLPNHSGRTRPWGLLSL
jgi:hypothetical protein